MRVIAEPIVASELQPGDLFSVRGPEYWDNFTVHQSIGESVYIRTEEPADKADDANMTVYKIIIEK